MGRDPKITLVELPPTEFGRLDGEFAKDVYTGMGLPPRAISLLHAILLKEGHRDVRSIYPGCRNENGVLTKNERERIGSSDYLLLSAITRTAPQTLELAQEYKKANPKGKVILGGPHATFLPEETIEKGADIVVRNEGDATLVELLDALEKNHSPEGISGVSYRRNGDIIHEKDRSFLTEEELSRLPLPHYEDETRKKTWVSVMETSRGCPRKCEFCSVHVFCGSKYRRKTNDSIERELRYIEHDGNPHLFFRDDDFVGNRMANTKDLLNSKEMAGIRRKIGGFSAQLPVSSANDENFLQLLKKAKCFAVYLGIESINDKTLKSLGKKGSNAEMNKEAVRRFRENKIWVHGMMIVGDEDTKESLEETIRWASDNLDSVQFFAPVPLPGTEFTRRMEKEGRILTRDYSLYDAQHVIIRPNPKNFTPYEMQMEIFDLNKRFYRSNYRLSSILRHPIQSYMDAMKAVNPLHRIYINRHASRIIEGIMNSEQTKKHIEFLKSFG